MFWPLTSPTPLNPPPNPPPHPPGPCTLASPESLVIAPKCGVYYVGTQGREVWGEDCGVLGAASHLADPLTPPVTLTAELRPPRFATCRRATSQHSTLCHCVEPCRAASIVKGRPDGAQVPHTVPVPRANSLSSPFTAFSATSMHLCRRRLATNLDSGPASRAWARNRT